MTSSVEVAIFCDSVELIDQYDNTKTDIVKMQIKHLICVNYDWIRLCKNWILKMD